MIAFPTIDQFKDIIQLAKREDLGPHGDDVTSRLLIDEKTIGVGTLVQRGIGITCGLPLVEHICRAYDERLRVEMIPGFHMEIIEGRFSDASRTPLVRIRGPMRSLLSAERVVLNFLQRLSGVATLTNRFVKRCDGTSAKIYDTRKTTPGFRALEKYAVRAGGGENHRIGLYDGLLVKDNHLAHVPLRQITPFVTDVVTRARAEASGRLVEVEVDSLDQLREVLKVDGVDVILLDNMDCPRMEQAVAMRNDAYVLVGSEKKPRVQLEASGGVTLEMVRSIALTGVNRIAVGGITHSAPALDIGLDIEEQ